MAKRRGGHRYLARRAQPRARGALSRLPPPPARFGMPSSKRPALVLCAGLRKTIAWILRVKERCLQYSRFLQRGGSATPRAERLQHCTLQRCTGRRATGGLQHRSRLLGRQHSVSSAETR